MGADRLEITDLLWRTDERGTPLPVRRTEVVGSLRARGQHGAARIAARLPVLEGEGGDGDLLDPAAVDALGLRVHRELSRLGEELKMPRRVGAVLGPLLDGLREQAPGPVRVVDVGCGIGHLVRSLAHTGALGPGVELVGVDLNPALVAEAERLREVEGLDCRFVHGDALEPGVAVNDPSRTVVVSVGMLHHLTPVELEALFRAQAGLGVVGWAHWDVVPCLWSTVGAWLFHRARMRERVSRHDGVLSARRAHPATVLLAAARAGAPAYEQEVREGPRWHPRAVDVLRPLVGARR